MVKSTIATGMLLGALVAVDAAKVNFVNKCGYNVNLFHAYQGGAENLPSINPGTTYTSYVNGKGHVYRHTTSPEATLAEITIDGGKVWYDISIIPPGPGNCNSYENCKQVTGKRGFNIPMSIVPKQNANGANCRQVVCPSDDKWACADAYHYPSDNSKMKDCPDWTEFDVVFCPGGNGGGGGGGGGQRERKAAAAAVLAATLGTPAPSVLAAAPASSALPPRPATLQVVKPLARTAASGSSSQLSATASEGSSSDGDDGDESLRALVSDAQKQAVRELPTLEATVAFLSSLLDRANAAGVSRAERRAAVDDVVAAVLVLGPTSDGALFVVDALRDCVAAKPASVREGALRILAALCKCDALVCVMEPVVVQLLVPIMQRHADSENSVKDAAAALARTVAASLPEIIPVVSESVHDTKKQVQDAALAALTAACAKISNDDVVPLVPLLVAVIARPEQTIRAVDALLATTFVSNVDAPTLALIAPLLHKALRDTSIHSSSLKRKASAIIDSMCRLVTRPSDVLHFVPLLLPQLETAIERLTDEEVVEAARGARAHLVHAAGGTVDLADDPIAVRSKLHAALLAGFHGALDRATHPALDDFTLEYVAHVCAELAMADRGAEWRRFVLPYLLPHMHDHDAERVCDALRAAGGGLGGEREKSTDPADVCDVDFSLAYGGKILLRNARLRLTRGHRYGLVGKNGVGKTTLMRNIATGAIDGLPETLRTVYVQHEDVVESCGSLLASMVAAPELAHQTPAVVEATLRDIGFTSAMLAGDIDALSGGWRMKLALARAMLYNADVLLLDEPTNHLDVHAVAWLVEYLNSLASMTVLLVSHDTGFLDSVCTDVLHYESKQLVLYPGTLAHFVTLHPEAKHYYELAATDTVFRLPQPGRLEGIASTTRRILTMDRCSYTYPGASAPQLSDIWKHHNVRLAYVAQHSFHHVEQHLESSPVEYFQWRFGGENGIDRELGARVNLKQSEEEKLLAGQRTGQIEKIVSRTKGKRGTLVYEAKLVGMSERHNKLYTLEQLQEMGLGKLAEAEDTRQATLAGGLDLRPLTTKEIQRHLDDFNLAAEFGTHGKIRGLSGGQKVKLVIAAAMWNRPHLLVLDEPTNYLDRAALGALADGIREFGGGVIMISHSEEFYNSLCTEKWLVESGRVHVVGEAQETEYRAGGGRKIIDDEPEEDKKTAGSINDQMKRTKLTNPKTLRPLSKQEIRKLVKLAKAAGKSFDDFVDGITKTSPEWKWL
ncbi:hypothetical protein PybrP1_008695 [[Pythium] brassicae (nom. inval.)]|nr:hypothetical protein PybrP1_008695 [[Pythium] brassicae (nom. inval.)]